MTFCSAERQGGVVFHRTDKKAKTGLTKPLDELTVVKVASQLLSCPKRQDLLQKMSQASLLEPARFNSLALKVIHNLINYCQSLPETASSYYSSAGGLLDHALNRTEAALSLFRKHIMQQRDLVATEEQALWSYVLFSASMLQGIGKLQTDYVVDLYDSNGQLLTRWNPLLENMISIGSYYYHQFQENNDDAFRCRLNLLFSKALMPSSGFAWIASNMRALKVWLALIGEGEDSGSGTLKAILSRADDIALQRELNALLLKLQREGYSGGRGNRIATFTDVQPTESTINKRLLGVKFIRWIQAAIADGRFVIHQGPLLVVTGGMVMSEIMYRIFVKEHPEYKKWQIVQNGLLSLGLHHVAADGEALSRVDLNDNDTMINGVVLQGTVMLPDEVKLFDVSIFADGSMRYKTSNDLEFDRDPNYKLNGKIDSVLANIILLIENNKFL